MHPSDGREGKARGEPRGLWPAHDQCGERIGRGTCRRAIYEEVNGSSTGGGRCSQTRCDGGPVMPILHIATIAAEGRAWAVSPDSDLTGPRRLSNLLSAAGARRNPMMKIGGISALWGGEFFEEIAWLRLTRPAQSGKLV